MEHTRHLPIIKRLRRAEGHLRSLIAMMVEGRDCVELAQQLYAIENAVANAKRELVHEHMSRCLEDAIATGSISPAAALSEVRAITKYL